MFHYGIIFDEEKGKPVLAEIFPTVFGFPVAYAEIEEDELAEEDSDTLTDIIIDLDRYREFTKLDLKIGSLLDNLLDFVGLPSFISRRELDGYLPFYIDKLLPFLHKPKRYLTEFNTVEDLMVALDLEDEDG